MRGRITLLAALLSVSCQRARVPIDGVWDRGGVSGDHFGNYYLVLKSAGDEISGHATLGLVRGEGTPTTFHHSATEAPQGCFSEGPIAGVVRHW
jgi:hypothetical protein